MFYATQEFVNHLRKEELKYTLHEAEDPESGKDRVIVKFGRREYQRYCHSVFLLR